MNHFKVNLDLIEKFILNSQLSRKQFCRKYKLKKKNLDLILEQNFDFQFKTLFQLSNIMNLDIFDLILYEKEN